jgi:pimeloyl-ACP methyl ester carboxylesterase
MTEPRRLNRPGQPALAFHRREGDGPGVMFLGGFKSDMTGTKATALQDWADRTDHAFLRFDYRAHGASDGAWEDATISDWREDALAILDQETEGEQILVGSSMGGWMALLLAMARPERVKALVLVAPAADFTEALIWEQLPFHIRQQIEDEGQWLRPNPYGPPYPITKTLIEDGRNWSILNAPIPFEGPVRILHGWHDRDVPWSHGLRVLEQLTSKDVRYELSKAGDHGLSTPEDLKALVRMIESVSG